MVVYGRHRYGGYVATGADTLYQRIAKLNKGIGKARDRSDHKGPRLIPLLRVF